MYRLNKYLLFALFPVVLLAQEKTKPRSIAICDSLFSAGALEEAIECYQALYERNNTGKAYKKYVDALLVSGDSIGAWRLTKKQSKKYGAQRPQYDVDFYYLSKAIGKKGPEKEDIKTRVTENPFSVRGVAMTLERYGELEFAVALYEHAEALRPNLRLAFERAQIYAQLGRFDEQYEAYLLAVEQNGSYQNAVRQRISQNISTDPEDAHNIAVKKALLAQLADGGAPVFENLLLYVYRQEQNFPLAFDFLQGKAKRGDFRPGELLALGRSAFEAQQVEQSHEILTFLIAERRKAPVMGWLENALRLMLEVKQEYGGLEDARTFAGKFSSGSCYPCFYWELTRDQFLFQSTLDTNDEALDRFDEKLVQMRTRYPSKMERGMTYHAFGDALLSSGYYEDAMLEFGRAESMLGDSEQGDQSRLSRAMCAFYSGDLPWAKTQLEVLLQSTSKSIANDAMEHALLIAANTVEDTAYEGLLLLRSPMLAETRGNWEDALEQYTRLASVLIANELYDDVLFRKGKVEMKLAKYAEAATTFIALQAAAGEGMWKEEAFYFSALAQFKAGQADAKNALEAYLISYPSGLYTEQARQFYRTFAP
ncbi:MAG: hypothetical protein ACPG4S_02340 [Schleiferiaceae bacterium]